MVMTTDPRQRDSFLSKLLSALLSFVTLLLESFVIDGSSSRGRDNDGADRDDVGHDTDEELQAAYKYFDTSEQEVTRESLKKKFKRLCLIHHPDRNGNSPESVKETQKINHYYDLLEQAIDQREGDVLDEEEEEILEEPEEPKPVSKSERRRRKKARKRQESEIRRQQAEMEREMRREWEEMNKKVRQFKRRHKQEKHKNRRTSIRKGLHTEEGRDKAHATWMQAVEQLQKQTPEDKREEQVPDLNDIDEDTGSSNETSEAPSQLEDIPKPCNPIMDCCSDEVAVLLRMGETDLAIGLLHDAIRTCVEVWAHTKRVRGYDQPQFDDSLREAVFHIITSEMDEDGNSPLHYAVYLEDAAMISYLVHEARQYDRFVEYVTKQNLRGQVAGDFAVCCKNDDNIPKMMSALWQEAEEEVKRNSLSYRFRRLLDRVYCQASFGPLLFTLASFFVGSQVFGCSWLVSLIVAGIAQKNRTPQRYESLFSFHIGWQWGVTQIWKGASLLVSKMSWPWLFTLLGLILIFQAVRYRVMSAISFATDLLLLLVSASNAFLCMTVKQVPFHKAGRAENLLRFLFLTGLVLLIQVSIRYTFGGLDSIFQPPSNPRPASRQVKTALEIFDEFMETVTGDEYEGATQ